MQEVSTSTPVPWAQVQDVHLTRGRNLEQTPRPTAFCRPLCTSRFSDTTCEG